MTRRKMIKTRRRCGQACRTIEIRSGKRKDRVIRLTINSSNMGDAVLTPKAETNSTIVQLESGYDLWERNFKENSTKNTG